MQYEIQLLSEGVSDLSLFAEGFIGRMSDGTEALAMRSDLALSAGVREYEIFRCLFRHEVEYGDFDDCGGY